jgi:hypothetical protein
MDSRAVLCTLYLAAGRNVRSILTDILLVQWWTRINTYIVSGLRMDVSNWKLYRERRENNFLVERYWKEISYAIDCLDISSPKYPGRLWGSSLLFKWYWGLFSWGYSNRGVKLTARLQLVAKLRMSGVTPPFATCLHDMHRNNRPYLFLL